MLILKYIIWRVNKGLEHEKKVFVRYHLYRFLLKNFYGWLELMTCGHTINTLEKGMNM